MKIMFSSFFFDSEGVKMEVICEENTPFCVLSTARLL